MSPYGVESAKTDFLPIVKLEGMRRGGNPAGPPVSESHQILIASGGDCAASASDLIEPRVVLATVKAASRRLRRWPSASLDRRCARRVSNPRPDGETALKPIRETAERFRDSPAMWLGDQTADQTASVSAAGHKPDQGAYPLHHAAHVRASDRADVGRHSGTCLWGRAGWQHVPNDRPCCATEREQRNT